MDNQAPIRRSPLTVAVIGGGVMGGTIFGAIAALEDDLFGDVVVAERVAARREALLADNRAAVGRGTRAVEDPAAAVAGADVVVLAVKPQDAPAALAALDGSWRDGALLVSVCAGLSTASLESMVPDAIRVVRGMPNTPARIGEGATAICPGSAAGPEDLDLVVALLAGTGLVVQVAEKHMDAVTGLSGSGPAYVLLAVEALVEAGVELGLTRDVANALAVQTVRGTAGLAQQPGSHPTLLREAVTSPGGTTAAGLAALEQRGLRSALAAGVRASAERSAALGA
ncbi:pyrroline-5-carboxylate reductase [Raineyella antarctica]|uniref:Pyrroline-5-carboxylate reductase n=1 Tax=Raineyella antarctica TaxID=1577474 RepID=A0A1G6GDZ0_9ACTN|nr:pyrroline-5-carboxylate reductase [Raineyella antarctica]SDB80232.1 pyrroline-5-carboxylate reductase [Raineyella antarctica]